MQDEVLEFIDRRWKGHDANWMEGNCYWFAYILCARFPKLEMIFLPIEGHFVAGDLAHNRFYDWTGLVELTEAPHRFSKILVEDPLWYSHILRDCRN